MKKQINNGFWIALAIYILLLLFVQALLVPKYASKSQEGNLIAEYYENAGNNDVVFIGDCEVYENFSPITLWEEYGITSYIRGSAQQMIWQSYYLMEETFRYETPKVMVFNVLSMMYDTPASTGRPSQREAYNRMTLDGMRWSSSKWNSIMASMTKEEIEWEAQYSYIFPILRYHDRWNELTAEDIAYLFHRDQVSDNGYLMQTGIKPVGDPYTARPLANYNFGENSYHYLKKMVELCEAHGTQLVLIKAPSLYPVWREQWEEQIVAYAEANNLLYINLLDAADEVGIDWNTDTYDAGLHLNVYGAEKLSSYFGKILSDDCQVPDRRENAEISALWAEKTAVYNERKQALEAASAS